VPELVQSNCTGEALAAALMALLRNPDMRARQRSDLAEAMTRLGVGEEPPSRRAARAILEFIRTRRD